MYIDTKKLVGAAIKTQATCSIDEDGTAGIKYIYTIVFHDDSEELVYTSETLEGALKFVQSRSVVKKAYMTEDDIPF